MTLLYSCSVDNMKSMKYLCLVLLTVQNASVTLVTRYAKTRDAPKFLDSSAVVVCEVVKLVLSFCVLCYDESGILSGLKTVYTHVVKDPLDLIKVSPTALLYFIQNQLVYVSISNLEAATHLVSFVVLSKLLLHVELFPL